MTFQFSWPSTGCFNLLKLFTNVQYFSVSQFSHSHFQTLCAQHCTASSSLVEHPRLLGLPGNSALRLVRNEVNVNITVWYNMFIIVHHLHVVTIMVFTQSWFLYVSDLLCFVRLLRTGCHLSGCLWWQLQVKRRPGSPSQKYKIPRRSCHEILKQFTIRTDYAQNMVVWCGMSYHIESYMVVLLASNYTWTMSSLSFEKSRWIRGLGSVCLKAKLHRFTLIYVESTLPWDA